MPLDFVRQTGDSSAGSCRRPGWRRWRPHHAPAARRAAAGEEETGGARGREAAGAEPSGRVTSAHLAPRAARPGEAAADELSDACCGGAAQATHRRRSAAGARARRRVGRARAILPWARAERRGSTRRAAAAAERDAAAAALNGARAARRRARRRHPRRRRRQAREEARRTAAGRRARAQGRRLWAMIEHWGWRFLIEDRTTVEGVYRNACVLTKQAPLARVATEGGARFAYASSDAGSGGPRRSSSCGCSSPSSRPPTGTPGSSRRCARSSRSPHEAHARSRPSRSCARPSCGAMAYTTSWRRARARAVRARARARGGGGGAREEGECTLSKRRTGDQALARARANHRRATPTAMRRPARRGAPPPPRPPRSTRVARRRRRRFEDRARRQADPLPRRLVLRRPGVDGAHRRAQRRRRRRLGGPARAPSCGAGRGEDCARQRVRRPRLVRCRDVSLAGQPAGQPAALADSLAGRPPPSPANAPPRAGQPAALALSLDRQRPALAAAARRPTPEVYNTSTSRASLAASPAAETPRARPGRTELVRPARRAPRDRARERPDGLTSSSSARPTSARR